MLKENVKKLSDPVLHELACRLVVSSDFIREEMGEVADEYSNLTIIELRALAIDAIYNSLLELKANG